MIKPKEDDILAHIKRCLDDANNFYSAHLQGKYGERQDVIDATPEYYNKKFKNLAKIPLTTSEVSDTIGWIMPALTDIFSGSDDVVKVQGVSGNDAEKAQSIQDLLNYQTERLNDGFMNRYFWILSCLQYNIGFKKKTWLREYKSEQRTGVFDNEEMAQLEQNPKIKIKKESLLSEGNGFDISPLYQVDYEESNVLKNQPVDEVIPVTELRWNSSTKNLKEATFVAHKKTVSIDHLLQKERQKVYFNIDRVKDSVNSPKRDTFEDAQRGYVQDQKYSNDDLTREVDIYECYVKYDMDGKQVLSDWIITVAGEAAVLIGKQKNTLGRFHPFVELVGMPDPWNVVPRKGLVEILAEIQHISTALTRLMIRHLAVSSQGRRFVDKNRVDQDDLLAEAMDVAVDGDPRAAVYPMPVTNVSPMTMPFFEYLQSKLRKSVGISEYNTGTDSQALNPTATGVTAIIDQANKKIRLMAKIMAQYFAEDYRYQIRLNQEFIDEPQVFRLLDKDIQVTPEDLEGNFDLIVNAGVGSANKQAELQNLQLIMATLEKIGAAFPGMVTPDKAYNIIKLLFEQMGHKNVDDFINSPEVMQKMQQMQQMAAMGGGGMNGIQGGPGQAPAGPMPAVGTGQGGPAIPGGGAAAGQGGISF